jgi:hypothetical protein
MRLNQTIKKITQSRNKCYGLNMKCPPPTYILVACLPAYELLGSKWIIRVLSSSMDLKYEQTIGRWNYEIQKNGA